MNISDMCFPTLSLELRTKRNKFICILIRGEGEWRETGGLRVASVLVTAGGNGTHSPAAALFRSPQRELPEEGFCHKGDKGVEGS